MVLALTLPRSRGRARALNTPRKMTGGMVRRRIRARGSLKLKGIR
jgi:hypothetical protein